MKTGSILVKSLPLPLAKGEDEGEGLLLISPNEHERFDIRLLTLPSPQSKRRGSLPDGELGDRETAAA